MKRFAFHITLLLISSSLLAFAQDSPKANEDQNNFSFRKINNTAFRAGEILEYKMAYGFMNAGVAKLEVKESSQKVKNRDLYHIVGTGKSISAFDWFFKVRDRYETYLDKEGIFPWLFIRRINEGGYKKAQDYQFFQEEGFVKNEDQETYEVPHGIQDMLSAFYYARTIDFSNAKKGDIFIFDSFVDEEIYPLRIRYAGIEKVKIGMGKFECMVFHPVVQEGRIFEDDDDLTVYITNDKNKIPILAKAKVLVGSMRMELTDYKNLANPVAKID
jgi:hypothetical protein